MRGGAYSDKGIDTVRDLHGEALVRLGLLLQPGSGKGLAPAQVLLGARPEVQEAAKVLARLAGRGEHELVHDFSDCQQYEQSMANKRSVSSEAITETEMISSDLAATAAEAKLPEVVLPVLEEEGESHQGGRADAVPQGSAEDRLEAQCFYIGDDDAPTKVFDEEAVSKEVPPTMQDGEQCEPVAEPKARKAGEGSKSLNTHEIATKECVECKAAIGSKVAPMFGDGLCKRCHEAKYWTTDAAGTRSLVQGRPRGGARPLFPVTSASPAWVQELMR